MKPTDELDPEDFITPENEAEKNGVIQTIYRERLRAEDDALVEALTEREQRLIDEAWRSATRAAQAELTRRLNSPHAVTLDAASVQRTVSGWSGALKFEANWLPRIPGAHHDERLASIVRNVDHHLEQVRTQREAA